jgi:hypothetical protein
LHIHCYIFNAIPKLRARQCSYKKDPYPDRKQKYVMAVPDSVQYNDENDYNCGNTVCKKLHYNIKL